MTTDPKSARITCIEVSSRAKTVWIEVDTYEALLGYKHEYDQYTMVTASKICSKEDLKAIRTHCKDTMFMTFERVATDDGAGASASADTKNKAPTGGVEEKSIEGVSPDNGDSGSAPADTKNETDTGGVVEKTFKDI